MSGVVEFFKLAVPFQLFIYKDTTFYANRGSFLYLLFEMSRIMPQKNKSYAMSEADPGYGHYVPDHLSGGGHVLTGAGTTTDLHIPTGPLAGCRSKKLYSYQTISAMFMPYSIYLFIMNIYN
jgi:hypothetical protein